MTDLIMPALSPTMEKGTLARWLVAPGDAVKSGDVIAEIETDKATLELEAEDAGTVAELRVAQGTADVPVGAVIAVLGAAGPGAGAGAGAGADPAPPPVAVPIAVPATVPVLQAASAPTAEPGATPLARRLATAHHIDLATITGTGARGRIVRADLGLPEPVAQAAPAVAASVPIAAFAPPAAGVPVESERLSGMRRTIARRLTEAKQTVPHFYLTARLRLDPLLALRAELNAALAARGTRLSVNDMLVKALALALVAVPEANVQFGGEVLHRFGRVDVAMAVAVDGGLVTPVIRDVGALSLSAISAAAADLATRARDNRLAPAEWEGGTVSISNLGMYGIDGMIPVINPPHALILGVAAGIEQPWKVDGGIALATIMDATASFDHRAIDGAVAARFMAALRELVESPLLLVG